MTSPLPCPFCGHDASCGAVVSRFAITCSNDYCPVESQATAHTLDEAIQLWNTREWTN